MNRSASIAFLAVWTLLPSLGTPSLCIAQQKAPGIGYMFPPGGAAGTTIDVTLGGYDWTPDLEVFVRNKQIDLSLTGKPGPVIVPEPPYWFGKKARRSPFLLPRETAARLTLPSDLPAGIYHWQVANANGASSTGRFVVSNETEVIEQRTGDEAQTLPALPTTVSGQILKIQEVDRYRFHVDKPGPVTIQTTAAKIGSPLTAIVEVHDENGRLVADGADTEARDLTFTFSADADSDYEVTVYDSDFRGNRAFVYRLYVSTGPRILATIPAAVRRDTSQKVTFIGYGLKTGQCQLEEFQQDVAAPNDSGLASFTVSVSTAPGTTLPVSLLLSDLPETTESAVASPETSPLAVPGAVTGVLDQKYGVDRYRLSGSKGDALTFRLKSTGLDAPMDLALTVIDSEGKELKRVDDEAGTTDAALDFTLPADGDYDVLVNDSSGHSGSPHSAYRLTVEPTPVGFTLTSPELVAVPVSGSTQLQVRAQRTGGFNGPIAISVDGLPDGVTVPESIQIAEKKRDVKFAISVAESAGTTAAMLSLKATATTDQGALSQTLPPVLLAVTLPPPFSIDAEGKNDVLKWPRGSTFPGPVLIEREESFDGEITLEMHSRQGRHRQGIRGPELKVSPGTDRVLYPVFLPEWLETTRTSRMVVNGVAQIPDPTGRVRHVLTKLKTRIGFLPTGALLKLSCPAPELELSDNTPFEFPIEIQRASELEEPATIELLVDDSSRNTFSADTLKLDNSRNRATLRIVPTGPLPSTARLTARATVQHNGMPVVSETHLDVFVQTTATSD
ncbi:MAG: PPC domain-containing protein [Planctomycetota bacterium]|jgi:hypothetical protein